MTELISQTDKILRQMFKKLNHFMLLIFDLGLANWFQVFPRATGQVLVITHIGRNSGLRYRTPANFAVINGDIYCTAAFGQAADWYLNILKNPNIEVWTPEGWWDCQAEDISNTPERITIMRQVLIGSGFAAYLFGVNPNLPNQELDNLTRNYRLLKITKKDARTGSGGPGKLAWIWPLVTFLLIPLAFRKKKK